MEQGEIRSDQPEQNAEHPVEFWHIDRMMLPVLKLLSDGERLSIVEQLVHQSRIDPENKSVNVASLEVAAGVPLSSCYKFLKELQQIGLVEFGSKAGYSATPEAKIYMEALNGLNNSARALRANYVIEAVRRGLGLPEQETFDELLTEYLNTRQASP